MSRSQKREKKKSWPGSIRDWLTALGGLGGIAAIILALMALHILVPLSGPTSTPTVTATGTPMATLLPTSTVQPNTPIPPTPENLFFPKDNCINNDINNDIWITRDNPPYPADTNNCLDLSSWGLTRNNYTLDLSLGNKTQSRGIYTKLPDGDFHIQFTVQINQMYAPLLTTAEDIDFGIVDAGNTSKESSYSTKRLLEILLRLYI
jgi:hypothetical protein